MSVELTPQEGSLDPAFSPQVAEATPTPALEERERMIRELEGDVGGTQPGIPMPKAPAAPLAALSAALSESKPRTCVMANVLPASVIELIGHSPHNATVRSLVLAHLKLPLPDECVTFDQIRDWIETTMVFPLPAPVPVLGRPDRISIQLNVTEDVTGTCRFSGQAIGSGDVYITRSDMEDLIEGAEDFEELISGLNDHIENENLADEVNTELDTESAQHDRHDVGDSDGRSWERGTSNARLAERLRAMFGTDNEHLNQMLEDEGI